MRGIHANEQSELRQEVPPRDLILVGYSTGLIRGVFMMAALRGLCIPGNASTSQAVAVVSKWMKAHPEKWAEQDVTLVYEALIDAFPCQTP